MKPGADRPPPPLRIGRSSNHRCQRSCPTGAPSCGAGRPCHPWVRPLRQDGPRLAVDIDIELEVRLAFITVYRYRHTNRELWDDGRLMGFTSRTDDNRTLHRVEARRVGDGGSASTRMPGHVPPLAAGAPANAG